MNKHETPNKVVGRCIRKHQQVLCFIFFIFGLTAISYAHSAQIIPRKILIFYQGKLNNPDERMGSPAVKMLSMPLNDLGYHVEVRNINESLPQTVSKEEFAGIIIAIDGILLGREQALQRFYQQQIQQHIPLLILNDFGFMLNNDKLKPFGLKFPLLTHKPHAFKIVYQSPLIGFEVQPILKTYNFFSIQIQPHQGHALFTIEDEVGLKSDIAGITPWGGYYIGPNYIVSTPPEDFAWVINPFDFFKQALQLPDMPIPDVTSENGRRLMFMHVDGDGFSNKGEWFGASYVSDIMRTEILEHYQLPATVSIVQGEIAANGLHPNESPELESIARKIFALPYVEIASHTFSHPFNWYDALRYKGKRPNKYTLPIRNYDFNLETEIIGSVDYINRTLAPTNKKCKVFLWSGEGDAPEKALALADSIGLRNLNPGTIITKYNHSLTRVSGLGVNEGPYYQVFAPIGNDQEVQGIGTERFFYTLINIITALQLTDETRRLKPIDIYMHFYTLAQPGGVLALKQILDWVLKQPILPIYASEYVDKVRDFNHLTIEKSHHGWLIKTQDQLREFKVPITMGYPDLDHSQHIAGYTKIHDHYYIHLAPGGQAWLTLTSKPATTAYLVDANARLTLFERHDNQLRIGFEGHLPIAFVLANTLHCDVLSKQARLDPIALHGRELYYTIPQTKKGEVTVQCH